MPPEYKFYFVFLISKISICLILTMVLFLRREEFGDTLRKGKTSGEKWKLFQNHVKQFSVGVYSIL